MMEWSEILNSIKSCEDEHSMQLIFCLYQEFLYFEGYKYSNIYRYAANLELEASNIP